MEAYLPGKATLGEEKQGPQEYIVRAHFFSSLACSVYAKSQLQLRGGWKRK
jgi:hypothetical protein